MVTGIMGVSAFVMTLTAILSNLGTFLDTETGRTAKDLLGDPLKPASQPRDIPVGGLSPGPAQPVPSAKLSADLVAASPTTRRLASDILPSVRKKVEKSPVAEQVRVEVTLEDVRFAGSARIASLSWRFIDGAAAGTCPTVEISFGQNAELAEAIATRVVASAVSTTRGGAVSCS